MSGRGLRSARSSIPFIGIIDRILEEDKDRPKKQRHTSKRIFERLRDEYGFTGKITIVKDYICGVRQRRREMFVPLTHPPGHAQVDFGEALAVIGGVERKIHFLAMSLPGIVTLTAWLRHGRCFSVSGCARYPTVVTGFPPVIIQHAVWLYCRFTLSYRDVEDLLAERGLDISYETVRRWVLKFGRAYARRIQRRRPRPTERWHLDEMVVVIRGRQFYLWRAVDSEGEVLNFLVQSRRNARAAIRLMRKLLKKQGFAPATIVTDKLPLLRRRDPFACPLGSA